MADLGFPGEEEGNERVQKDKRDFLGPKNSIMTRCLYDDATRKYRKYVQNIKKHNLFRTKWL